MLRLPHAQLLLARLLHGIVSLQQAFLDKRQEQCNFSKLSFPTKGLSFWNHCPYLHVSVPVDSLGMSLLLPQHYLKTKLGIIFHLHLLICK